MPRFNKKKFLQVYREKGCNISATCDAVNISRTAFYKAKKEHPSFAEGIDEVNESLIDYAESMLMSNIKDGKETSIIFYLKTKGKERGYVERVEQEVTVNPFLELMKKASVTEDE